MLILVMAGVAGMIPGIMTRGIIAHGVTVRIGVTHPGMVRPGVSDGIGAGEASIPAGMILGIMAAITVVVAMVVITVVTMDITVVAGTGLVTGIREVVRL